MYSQTIAQHSAHGGEPCPDTASLTRKEKCNPDLCPTHLLVRFVYRLTWTAYRFSQPLAVVAAALFVAFRYRQRLLYNAAARSTRFALSGSERHAEKELRQLEKARSGRPDEDPRRRTVGDIEISYRKAGGHLQEATRRPCQIARGVRLV